MQDIINSFKAHLYERTSSPLIGSFIFYWVVCNYKLVIVLLDGDLKANEKFELIKTLYPQNIWTPWEGFDIHYSALLGNGFLIPLVISLIYIFAIPKPAKFIYKFWKQGQKEILDIKQRIDDETPLTKEQSKKIRQDMINLEIEYEKIFSRKEEEINQLKILLKEAPINENNFPSDKNLIQRNYEDSFFGDRDIDISLTDLQKRIMENIGNDKENHTSKISESLGIDLITAEHNIDELLNIKLIQVINEFNNGNKRYELTPFGRKFLIKNREISKEI